MSFEFFRCISTSVAASSPTSVTPSLARSVFAAHRQAQFIAPAYYMSMGFAVPASIGVAMATKKLRPYVLVGDGAFQMTGVEISTIVRLGLNPDHHRSEQRWLRHDAKNS